MNTETEKPIWHDLNRMKVILSKKRLDGSRKMSLVLESYDLWKLDVHSAKIIHAGLIEYRKHNLDRPPFVSMKQWHKILDAMIESFRRKIDAEWTDEVEGSQYLTERNIRRSKEGIDLFEKYYRYIWF